MWCSSRIRRKYGALILLSIFRRTYSTKYYLNDATKISIPSSQQQHERAHRKLLLDVPFGGDPACPCATAEELASTALSNAEEVGNSTDLDTYGVGCGYHDIESDICQEECQANTPLVDCRRTWCQQAWCWVDPMRCQLSSTKSAWFVGSDRFYSYPACRNADVFKFDSSLLKGTSLRVGLVHNSGGWKGTYHKSETDDGDSSGSQYDFEGPIDNWRGPTLTFVTESFRLGAVNMTVTRPPSFLKEPSRKYNKRSSNFDLCVYATTLGFIGKCSNICISLFAVFILYMYFMFITSLPPLLVNQSKQIFVWQNLPLLMCEQRRRIGWSCRHKMFF